MAKAGISGNTFGQKHTIRQRSLFEELFCRLVGVKKADLKIQDGFSSHTESEMSRFNDAGMNGTDRDLKHSLPFYGSEYMPRTIAQRDRCHQIEILAQRKDLIWPIVVGRNLAWIRVAHRPYSKPIADFSFVPVHRGNRRCERWEFGLIRRNGDSNEEKSTRAITGEGVVNVEHTLLRALI